MMRVHGVWLTILLSCVAPRPADEAESTVAREASAPLATPSAAPSTEAEPNRNIATKIPTALYPTLEGACPPARITAVGATAVLSLPRDLWALDPAGPRALARLGSPRWDLVAGRHMTEDGFGELGGRDEAHLWYVTHSFTARGEDYGDLTLLGPPSRVLATPHGENGFYSPASVIQHPDGTLWLFGVHSMYLDIPGDEKLPNDVSHDRYFAFREDGTPIEGAKLPGADMGHAFRLASGEIVGAGLSKSGAGKLRRWSPSRRVNDLALREAGTPALQLGSTRAVLRAPAKNGVFYLYKDGEDALRPSALGARARQATSWLVTGDDELLMTLQDGTLLREDREGVVHEERLPEPGKLQAVSSPRWLAADSGALYVQSGAAWNKVALSGGGPPARVEWVALAGGETWVSTVRTDTGFGRRRAGEVRVLHSSRPARSPVRCGAPFSAGTLAELPPTAGPSCATPVVVVASEPAASPKGDLPKLRAALKRNAALGSTLTFVRFGAGDERLVGILAETPEVRDAILKSTHKLTVAEVVCGAPHEIERRTFRVADGTFEP